MNQSFKEENRFCKKFPEPQLVIHAVIYLDLRNLAKYVTCISSGGWSKQ